MLQLSHNPCDRVPHRRTNLLGAPMAERLLALPPRGSRGMPQTLYALIRKLEAVAALSAEEKAAVLALPVTIRKMRADHDIVREKDRPSQCCLVLDGWLCRYKILETGTRQIFSFHIPGDIPD